MPVELRERHEAARHRLREAQNEELALQGEGGSEARQRALLEWAAASRAEAAARDEVERWMEATAAADAAMDQLVAEEEAAKDGEPRGEPAAV